MTHHQVTSSARHAPAAAVPANEGAVTLFVVVLATALLAMAGLVVDGGYALAARQEAATTAEEAARAGADALSQDSIRSGGALRVDAAAATSAVTRYLSPGPARTGERHEGRRDRHRPDHPEPEIGTTGRNPR